MKKVLSFLLCLMLLLSAIPTAAAVTDNEPDGGFYVVFKGDNYTIRERNRLNYYGGDVYLLGGLTMSLSTPFKIAYSSDLKTVSKARATTMSRVTTAVGTPSSSISSAITPAALTIWGGMTAMSALIPASLPRRAAARSTPRLHR